MPFINFKDDLPVFRIKHDVGEVKALRIPAYHVAPLFKESLLPPASPRGGDTLCPTLWAMCGLLPKFFHVTELRQCAVYNWSLSHDAMTIEIGPIKIQCNQSCI